MDFELKKDTSQSCLLLNQQREENSIKSRKKDFNAIKCVDFNELGFVIVSLIE